MTYVRDARSAMPAVMKALKVFEQLDYAPKHVDEKGHDIILSDGSKVEVKYDTWIVRTGNIAYEWWSDKTKKTEGWGQYCDADILVYFFNFDCAYVFDMPKLKAFVQGNYKGFAQKGTPFSQALNLMVHITQVAKFRIKKLESHFWDKWYDDKIGQAPPLKKLNNRD